jgi:hypothetical protein
MRFALLAGERIDLEASRFLQKSPGIVRKCALIGMPLQIARSSHLHFLVIPLQKKRTPAYHWLGAPALY